jgi:hypothetical protein
MAFELLMSSRYLISNLLRFLGCPKTETVPFSDTRDARLFEQPCNRPDKRASIAIIAERANRWHLCSQWN